MEVDNKCNISAQYLQNCAMLAKNHRDMGGEYHYSHFILAQNLDGLAFAALTLNFDLVFVQVAKHNHAESRKLQLLQNFFFLKIYTF